MFHLHLAGGAVGDARGGAGVVQALDHGGADGAAEGIVGGEHAPTAGDAAAVAAQVIEP